MPFMGTVGERVFWKKIQSTETYNQSGGINVALKTPSLHGKHTECGARDRQY